MDKKDENSEKDILNWVYSLPPLEGLGTRPPNDDHFELSDEDSPQAMPTYQYEAMDHTGREVKGTIDASTQEEAQQLIRQEGLYVTKISGCPERVKRGKAAAMPNVTCPSCGVVRDIPPSFIGSVKCKQCGTSFQAAPGAKLNVTCPSCGVVRDIPPSFIGSVKCKQCGTFFQAALGAEPKVTCPWCGMLWDIGPGYIGSVQCSQCRNDFLAAHAVATWPKAPPLQTPTR